MCTYLSIKCNKYERKILRIFFIITIFIAQLLAVSSANKFKVDSEILDMILKNNTLYVSTASGVVELFDITTKKQRRLLKLKPLINFFDEEYDAKIYSIDVNKNGDLLLLAEASGGKRRILIYKDGKLEKISSENCRKPYKEARFVGVNKILLVTLSNEVSLYDVKKKETIYSHPLSTYSFSDFALNKDLAAITGESGDVYIFDYEKNKVINTLSGANKDNIYSIDYRQNTILTAGQDRVVGLYNVQTKKYKKVKTDFLVYACALSNDAGRSAYLSNEDSQIKVIDNESLELLAELNGHKSTVNRIIFVTNTHILSSSDDGEILEWVLDSKK